MKKIKLRNEGDFIVFMKIGEKLYRMDINNGLRNEVKDLKITYEDINQD